MATTDELDEALRAILARDNRLPLQLDVEEGRGLPDALPNRTGPEFDQLLRDLIHLGRLEGNVTDTAPSGRQFAAYWSGLRVTIEGLRQLGEWPPDGRGHLRGDWDNGVWGQIDKPLLESLQGRKEEFVIRPDPNDPLERQRLWEGYLRLLDAELVEAEVQPSGLSEIRLTTSGQAVLNPPKDDPLHRASVDLRQGSKADAVTAAVDEALKPHMQALARKHPIDTTTKKGGPKKLAQLNEELRAAGVYLPWVESQITAWLDLRAEVDHGGGANVDPAWIELMIQGIERFLDEFAP